MKRPKADKRPCPKSPGIQAETISASDAQAEADRIAEAIVASAQMNQDAAYLTSGRRFKNLSEAKHSKNGSSHLGYLQKVILDASSIWR